MGCFSELFMASTSLSMPFLNFDTLFKPIKDSNSFLDSFGLISLLFTFIVLFVWLSKSGSHCFLVRFLNLLPAVANVSAFLSSSLYLNTLHFLRPLHTCG